MNLQYTYLLERCPRVEVLTTEYFLLTQAPETSFVKGKENFVHMEACKFEKEGLIDPYTAMPKPSPRFFDNRL